MARKIIIYELELQLNNTIILFDDLNRKTWKQWLQFWRYENIDNDLLRSIMLAEYWHYKLIDARIEGQLPAWEGIRIVCERQENSYLSADVIISDNKNSRPA